jgi:signal transduction histidine kinase
MASDPTTIAAPAGARLPVRALRAVAPAGEGRPAGEERFAAYIAHELRTPLATQRALLELALSDPLSGRASWRDIAEEVLTACLQQERLLEACLTLARSRCGVIRRDRVDLATIAFETIRTHDRSGLECILALEPTVICGDPALVERLVANLVSNAVRHNLRGGRLEVTTRAAAGQAMLVVANSGPLIPAVELRRLFQPFQRLDSNGGIGLGLAIVQAIADAHNASVTARALVGGGLAVEVAFQPAPGL